MGLYILVLGRIPVITGLHSTERLTSRLTYFRLFRCTLAAGKPVLHYVRRITKNYFLSRRVVGEPVIALRHGDLEPGAFTWFSSLGNRYARDREDLL